MGLLFSTNKTQPEIINTPNVTNVELPNESPSTQLSTETPNEATSELSSNNTNTVDVNKVVEKIVNESGTKVEVVPVEVAETDDVIKKSKKRKNKNKH